MAAQIDVYNAKNQLPAAPTHATLAIVVEPGPRASLWIFVGGTGWIQAAHGASG